MAVSVRADLMEEDGSLHLERAGLIAYNHGLYQELGRVSGFFGWSVARPEVFRRRMKAYRKPDRPGGGKGEKHPGKEEYR